MTKDTRGAVNDKLIAFRLPTALYKAIAVLAKEDNRSVSNYIVTLLAAHVARRQGDAPQKTKGGK